ncbi:MAG TPA: ABC transporter ATP-binding protein [Candidatus Avilachnospira avistercoris]|nr:ABC transporter ATP-binding protein [Candidatus Avilachnospira avistercoris]
MGALGEVIIKTEGLTKCYGEKRAVSDLDLEIYKGEVFGLLGPNGAGKTTTTLMLLGLSEPSGGSAFIDGHDCTREPIEVKRMVGYLPDSVGFYPDMTGRENLRFTGRLNGLPENVTEERIEDLLSKVGMQEAADKKTLTYSRGMKQRLGIADVLMKDPKVIIMDEPTLGIDPEGMRELMALIRRLSEEEGRTILISSHQLYQVQQICDRVGIFVEGKLIACGRIDELGDALGSENGYSLEVAAYPDNVGFRKLLESLEGVRSIEREGEHYVVISDRDLRRDIQAMAVKEEYLLTRIRQRSSDLDEIYRRYFEKAEKAEKAVKENGNKHDKKRRLLR